MKKQLLLILNAWILFAGLVSFLSFSANAQHNSSSNKKPANIAGTQQKRADIYLAGYSMPDGKTPVATYLKNGVAVLLANTQSQSEIVSLVVAGNDVYAAGMHNGQAVYWKNNTEVQLSNTSGTGTKGYANDMAIDNRNGDVYVVGYERFYSSSGDLARCWKNGKPVPLNVIGGSNARSVAIDYKTGDVYIAGFDSDPQVKNDTKYWKNGEPVKIINDPLPVRAASIRIFNNNLYIVGQYAEPGGQRVAYWCGDKGTVSLTAPSSDARATAIAISGKNVYVAGWENGVVKYWKNDVPTVLARLAGSGSDPYKIAVDGDDVYVAGLGQLDGSIGMRYWKNGQLAGTVNLFINDIVVTRQGDNLVKNVKSTPAVKDKQPAIAEPPPAPVALTPKEEAEKFLAENKKKPGIITTASGLQYEIISQGTGPKPLATDNVKFNFQRTAMVGRESKETSNSHSPLNKIIRDLLPGLAEGIQLMSAGSKYRLFLPPKLGLNSPSPDYPAGSVILIWEIELLEILK
jgi:FKBP-type peptidyl-prolyl cis-trans isomerase